MAYLGVPQSKLENLTTNVQIVNLSASFDGTTTTFNLQDSRGDAVYAVHERALLVILGGITQKPGVDYTTTGTTITFTTAPVNNLTIHIRKLYGVQRIIGVNDGVISPVKLSTGGPVWNSSGNVTISGDLNVTGAFNAGGNGLFWEDSERANFGDDNDLHIYHDGNSYLNSTSGNLYIKSENDTDIYVRAADDLFLQAGGTSPGVKVIGGGATELYHVALGEKKLETTSNGIKIHEDTDKVIEFSGAITQLGSIPGIQSTNTAGSGLRGLGLRGSEIRFAIGGSEQVRIASGGLVGIGNTSTNTPVERLAVYSEDDTSPIDTGLSVYRSTADDKVTINAQGGAAKFIADGGSSYIPVRFFRHNGTNTYETLTIGVDGKVGIGQTNPTSDLHIGNFSANAYELKLTGNALQFNRSSNSYIDQVHDTGNILFRMTSSNLTKLRINHDGTIKLPNDNQKLVIGSGDDLQLYHTGNHSRILEAGAGKLQLGSDTQVEILNGAFSIPIAQFNPGGSVVLRHNNTTRIETTDTGAKITGDLEVTQEYPDIRPSLNLMFATNKSLDDRVTFRRDSIATYYGDDGLLKYASVNEPRFNHDPDTGESLGLLIEDPGTNLISGAGGYGSDTRNGNANLGNAPTSSVVDGITLPDGTVGKVRRIQSHPNGNSGMRWGSTGGGNINTPYSASVWARAVSGTASFTIDANDNGTASYTLTEEWVRMQCTGQTGEGAYQFMDIMGSGGADAYFWGFQLENNGLVTSYIPVESHMSNNTRANDVAYITGENFTDFYNQSEGTLVLSADIAYLPTSNQAAVVFEDESSASTDLIALGYRVGGGSSGNLGSWYQGNGSQVAYFNHNAGITANTEFRQAFAYKKDNLASSVNGGTPQTDNSGTLSTSIDRVKFGGYYADTMKSGHIRYFKYFSKRLSNSQLQGLTHQ
jgi:hypothetical protein